MSSRDDDRSGPPRPRSTPRAGTPRASTPRTGTPRTGTPGTGTPRAGTPRAASSRPGRSLDTGASRSGSGTAGSRALRTVAGRGATGIALGRPVVRLRSGLVIVLVLLALIGVRLVWLQGVQGAAYADQAVEQRT